MIEIEAVLLHCSECDGFLVKHNRQTYHLRLEAYEQINLRRRIGEHVKIQGEEKNNVIVVAAIRHGSQLG